LERARHDPGVIQEIVSIAERPDLADPMWDMPNDWPPFMKADPIGELLFMRLPQVFPDWQIVALDAVGAVVGKVNAIPFAWSRDTADLPGGGWDEIQLQGYADQAKALAPNAVSLLEARIVPGLRGTGLAPVLLGAMRDRVRAAGMADLFGPVRPSGKTTDPLLPMADYLRLRRPDGLLQDPWLRTHERLGATVVGVCPSSMTVAAPLSRWRGWTGLPLLESGPVAVPGAISPVHVSVPDDVAVYVEANVWMHHRVSG
jgi:hypothetical protein